jgi:hypothetical protein
MKNGLERLVADGISRNPHPACAALTQLAFLDDRLSTFLSHSGPLKRPSRESGPELRQIEHSACTTTFSTSSVADLDRFQPGRSLYASAHSHAAVVLVPFFSSRLVTACFDQQYVPVADVARSSSTQPRVWCTCRWAVLYEFSLVSPGAEEKEYQSSSGTGIWSQDQNAGFAVDRHAYS